MDRTHVGEVADVAREEGEPAGWIDRFEDDPRAGPQLVVRKIEGAHQVGGLQMLDDLNGDDAAEGTIRQGAEISQEVGFRDVEAALAAHLDHLVIDVQASRADAGGPEEVEELASAAAHVEHVSRASEHPDIWFEARADLVLRSAEAVLEPDVFVAVDDGRSASGAIGER